MGEEFAGRARLAGRAQALLCALLLFIAVLCTWPFVEMGIDDDWSFIRTAQVMAETGHFVYNGWAAMILGWQALLGAAFIKAFGFSFSVARIPVFALALLTACVCQRSMVRLGLNEWNATIGTLTMVLSPIYLPLAFTFMSDIAAFLVMLLCLDCCCRAVQAVKDRAALRWLCVAALSNIVLGTVRQTAWLGVLVMVPSTAWLLRKRRGLFAKGIVLWLLGIGSVWLCLHWFLKQPYAVPEKLIPGAITGKVLLHLSQSTASAVASLALFVLPVSIAYPAALLSLKRCRRRGRLIFAALVIGTATIGVLAARMGGVSFLLSVTMPWLGNLVTREGVLSGWLIGERPVVLHLKERIFLTLLPLFATAGCGMWFMMRRGIALHREEKAGTLSMHALTVLLLPFGLAYCALLMPRAAFAGIFDRYLIVPLYVVAVYLLRNFQKEIADRVPMICAGVVGLIAISTIAGTHDLFAMDRARVKAAKELLSAGVARNEIVAGVEYDGWTQLEAWGYMNVPDLTNPAGAYHLIPGAMPAKGTMPKRCDPWMTRYAPALEPRYELAYDESCLHGSPFAPVIYHTWLAPYTQRIYIRER